MTGVRTGAITALTGMRIVAAIWVVLFHCRSPLWAASPRLHDDAPQVAPSARAG